MKKKAIVKMAFRVLKLLVSLSLLLLIYNVEVCFGETTSERFQYGAKIVSDVLFQQSSSSSLSLSKVQKNKLTVFGAGFPRTGTKSIEKALRLLLGHNNIYDLRSIMKHNHGKRWLQAAINWKNHNNITDLELLVNDLESLGYTATLDFPVNLFVPALIQIRPQAKVILSVRDSVDQWLGSYEFIMGFTVPLLYCRPWKWLTPDTSYLQDLFQLLANVPPVYYVYPTHLNRPLPWYETLKPKSVIYNDNPQFFTALRRHYLEFQEYIKQEISAENLLIYNVKEGWEPWISFFDLEPSQIELTRSEEFPNINDRKSLQIVQNILHFIAIGFPLWILVILFAVYMILRWVIIRLIFFFIVNPIKKKNKKNDCNVKEE